MHAARAPHEERAPASARATGARALVAWTASVLFLVVAEGYRRANGMHAAAAATEEALVLAKLRDRPRKRFEPLRQLGDEVDDLVDRLGGHESHVESYEFRPHASAVGRRRLRG